MKVWSWGRASRSVGNKPVDFLFLVLSSRTSKGYADFCSVIAGIWFQHFRKNNAWKFVWSLSCWHLIGNLKIPSQNSREVTGFRMSPETLEFWWRCGLHASGTWDWNKKRGINFLGCWRWVWLFSFFVWLLAWSLALFWFALFSFVLSCFGLFGFFCWLCLCIFACLQAFTQTYWWLMSLFCHDVDDGDDADCRSRCRIDDGCVVDCCSRWWRWC